MYIDLSSDDYATDNQSKVEIHNIQNVIYIDLMWNNVKGFCFIKGDSIVCVGFIRVKFFH